MTLDRQASYVQKVVWSLLANEAYVATKYIAANQIVRATRKLARRKIDKRGNVEVVLTIGRPNFLEQEFIKQCKKANEPFPIKGVVLRFPPKPCKQK